MAVIRHRRIEIINDFDKSKNNYKPPNFISLFELSSPTSLRKLLNEYIKKHSISDQEAVFKIFIYYYFIWKLSTEVLLHTEETRESTVKRWWGTINENTNPFKTKCILNKANFAYEKNLLTTTHHLSLKSTYFSLLFLCVKIERLWTMYITVNDECFEKFIRNEIPHDKNISEDLKNSIGYLFRRLLITSKKLLELSSQKKGIPTDEHIRRQRSSKAGAARNSGRQDLINEFKKLFTQIDLNLNTPLKDTNKSNLKNGKIKNFKNLYDCFYLEFIQLISEYQKSAKQKNKNYGLTLQADNLDTKFKDWSKRDEDFRVLIDKIYNSDMPSKKK
ncbi:hypothetical protein [Comamonas testosteroni]|uniref:Uncharacterized protein n=1 Tax=Comamonas testosteroni TaxID=285 RepID=A0A8B4S199_COMTE|nr:hypothetical protein [Comamonas testosteroni]SUY76790.1 Uncharacterised protein [Comamonas testosteroni]